MKLFLFGYGKMGQILERLSAQLGYEIVGIHSKHLPLESNALKKAQVLLDFSSADAVMGHLETALNFQKPIVIGTTGWEKDLPLAKKRVEEKKGCVLYSPNFSLGVFSFIEILKKARELLAEHEMAAIEVHHGAKKDAPSGTAKLIERALEMKKPFVSLRVGQVAGKHEMIFDSPDDTLTFSHEAKSKEGFAKGALEAAKWILNQKEKRWWTHDEFFRSFYSTRHAV